MDVVHACQIVHPTAERQSQFYSDKNNFSFQWSRWHGHRMDRNFRKHAATLAPALQWASRPSTDQRPNCHQCSAVNCKLPRASIYPCLHDNHRAGRALTRNFLTYDRMITGYGYMEPIVYCGVLKVSLTLLMVNIFLVGYYSFNLIRNDVCLPIHC